MHLWDTAHGQLLAVLRGYQGRPGCVTLANDGMKIAAGAEDGQLLLWDALNLAAAGAASSESQK